MPTCPAVTVPEMAKTVVPNQSSPRNTPYRKKNIYNGGKNTCMPRACQQTKRPETVTPPSKSRKHANKQSVPKLLPHFASRESNRHSSSSVITMAIFTKWTQWLNQATERALYPPPPPRARAPSPKKTEKNDPPWGSSFSSLSILRELQQQRNVFNSSSIVCAVYSSAIYLHTHVVCSSHANACYSHKSYHIGS